MKGNWSGKREGIEEGKKTDEEFPKSTGSEIKHASIHACGILIEDMLACKHMTCHNSKTYALRLTHEMAMRYAM